MDRARRRVSVSEFTPIYIYWGEGNNGCRDKDQEEF